MFNASIQQCEQETAPFLVDPPIGMLIVEETKISLLKSRPRCYTCSHVLTVQDAF